MSELTDKVKGAVDSVIGKVKQQSSDPDTQAEGVAQEAKGKGEQVVGQVKGALGDKI